MFPFPESIAYEDENVDVYANGDVDVYEDVYVYADEDDDGSAGFESLYLRGFV